MSNAGWWPDPLGRNELRYHDGVNWTDHVSNHGATAVDPVAAVPPPVPQPASTYEMPTQPMAHTQPIPSQAIPTDPSPFAPPTEGMPTQPVAGGTSPFGTPPIASKDMPFGFNLDAPPPLIQDAGPPKRLAWVVVGAGVLVVGVVVAILLAMRGGGDDDTVTNADTEPVATASPATEIPPITTGIVPPATSPPADTGVEPTSAPTVTDAPLTTDGPTGSTAPATAPVTAPTGEIPNGNAGPVPVGTTIRGDGSIVRVNSVTANAPGDDFFEPDPGNTITAIDVEACAGPDGFAANAFYWSAYLADNTAAENFLFADDFESLRLAPGGCIRGTITYEVPDGNPVTSVVLTNLTFDEIGRWTVDGAIEPSGSLVPETEPASVRVGETVTFGAGHTVTLRSVEDAAPPLEEIFAPEAGRQYNRIDVELCAGDETLPVNALYWFGVATDHFMGNSALVGDTLELIDLAKGQCAAGLVELDLREGSQTAYVVFTDTLTDEVARWKVG